ncbi:transposase [Pseudalkalibacillus sp. A8]|uniref:transposase n=1 Tax=Pseudalkalibacillus sp. A8 TaxID=3382641 RepID=UPI0038B5C6CA
MPKCTKAKGNRQVHWNPIFEEMKVKAKAALESEENVVKYAQRKVEVESVFGHIKGNRSFRRFSLRGLDKVHVEFGIVALAHNLLKVAGLRMDTFQEKTKTRPSRTKNATWSCFILGLIRRPLLFIQLKCPFVEDHHNDLLNKSTIS